MFGDGTRIQRIGRISADQFGNIRPICMLSYVESEKDMPPLRTAIIGCGGFAGRHAQLFTTMPEQFELVAFSDLNLERAAHFASDFTAGQAAAFGDHHRLLDQVALDVVAICVPPYGHTDEVESAAERGVHVFIEKPIALSMDQAWRMVHAAEAAGIVTQVGFNVPLWRGHSAAQAAH